MQSTTWLDALKSKLSTPWKLPGQQYVLLVSILNTLLFNGALFVFLGHNLDLATLSGLAIAASVVMVVWLFNLIIFSLLAILLPFLIRPFLVITSLVNALALYYMFTYQVVLDKSMIGNIFNTKTSEASELITPTLFLYLVTFGLLPAVLFFKLRMDRPNRGRVLLQLGLLTFLISGFLYANASSWLWIDKHTKLLGGKILPWSYIINTVRHYAEGRASADDYKPLPLGQFRDQGKQVVVLIIGEAARAQNFSLYGYKRETNPLLKKDDIVVVPNAYSCTTYTTGSLACMLSHDPDKTDDEPLPSYLARMGVEVVWRTNNWGEPPLRITEYQKRDELRKVCQGEGCGYDEVLLTNLVERIRKAQSDKVFVVLHMKGSHGPSYYSRYPSNFNIFSPVCRHEEISKCTQEELINAYDNTIVYTDYFLDEAIQQLKTLTDQPVLMMYVSDHGESLGENGLYLHGTPYLFAPEYQKKIPFLLWMNPEFRKHQNLSEVPALKEPRYGHENVFHTIIGALGVESDAYKPGRDLLR